MGEYRNRNCCKTDENKKSCKTREGTLMCIVYPGRMELEGKCWSLVDNDLARTHNLRKLGGNSDTDTSQGIEQKHPTKALKYIDDNIGGHHRNKHPVTYLESGDPPPRYCQDEQMATHKLAKHADHGNEISKTGP